MMKFTLIITEGSSKRYVLTYFLFKKTPYFTVLKWVLVYVRFFFYDQQDKWTYAFNVTEDFIFNVQKCKVERAHSDVHLHYKKILPSQCI